MDVKLAQRMGFKMEPIYLQSVSVADGSELRCDYMCNKFNRRLQVNGFCTDVLLIPLRSCDMVLSV